MPSKDDISFPAPILPRDLRELSRLRLHRSSTIDTTVSGASDLPTSAYESHRQQEKRQAIHHASGGDWIELFYDLFFAASLSAFSRTREISSEKDLIDLATFFSKLIS